MAGYAANELVDFTKKGNIWLLWIFGEKEAIQSSQACHQLTDD